jgi:signal transduction histidine kinase
MQPPIHILLIEDDEHDYLLTLDCIEAVVDGCYEVTWETDGMAAIAGQLPFDMYDVVLVDYHVGGVTGVEIVQAAAKAGVVTPFILLTGHTDREIDYAAMQAGAVDHLVKDRISPDAIEKAIRYAVAAAGTRRDLSQKSEMLTATLESTDVGMAAFDVEDQLVMWNRRMAELAAEPGAAEEAIRNAVLEIRNQADDRRGRAVEIEKPSGNGVLEARIRSLETGGYTLACFDVSKHKAIEDTLLEAKDEAEHLSIAKSLFITRLSHEMRTPLHAVIGFGEMLPNASENELDDYADIIVSSGRCLVNKIDQMLELSRMDLGEVNNSTRDVPAKAIAKEAVTIALKSDAELAQRLEVDQSAKDVIVTGDHRILSNAMAEFISNAAKYGAPNSPITIGATVLSDRGDVRLWVSNTPAPDQAPITIDVFESFGQADQSLERAQEGLGIGLTYVRAVAHLHAGEASLEQDDESGLITASINLPSTDSPGLRRSTEIMNVA